MGNPEISIEDTEVANRRLRPFFNSMTSDIASSHRFPRWPQPWRGPPTAMNLMANGGRIYYGEREPLKRPRIGHGWPAASVATSGRQRVATYDFIFTTTTTVASPQATQATQAHPKLIPSLSYRKRSKRSQEAVLIQRPPTWGITSSLAIGENSATRSKPIGKASGRKRRNKKKRRKRRKSESLSNPLNFEQSRIKAMALVVEYVRMVRWWAPD